MERPMQPLRGGFTLIELAILVLAIALIVSVTLPAIAQTRDLSMIGGSKDNLRQLGMAHAMYGADFNDNQWTLAPHDLPDYGNTADDALQGWCDSIDDDLICPPWLGSGYPAVYLGYGLTQDGLTTVWAYHGIEIYALPLSFDGHNGIWPGWGMFRMSNVRSFNRYVNGKVHDPTLYAPKHEVAIDAVGACFDDPYEFCPIDTGWTNWSTYSLSPAALFHPDVWSVPEGEFPDSTNAMFADPAFSHAFKTPTYSQAKYPHLKTHMMENAWLQNNEVGPCIPDLDEFIEPGHFDGCTSKYFNASMDSAPVTLFYDGHIRLLPMSEVKAADEQFDVWRRDTPFGEDGYFHEHGLDGPDNPELSHHILTNGGILGRDTLGPGFALGR